MMKNLLILFMCLPLMTVTAQADQDQYYTARDGKSKMYFRENGKGDNVVLMIHGLGSNSGAFTKLEKLVGEYCKTVVIDLPGYGKSEDHGFEPGMKNYAGLIAEFVAERQYDNVVLAGHSMGGQIAMTAALQEGSSSWLKGLFLMAPAGIETFNENDHNWFNTYVTPQTMAMVPDAQLKQNFDINFATGKLPEDAMFMYEERLGMKEDQEKFNDYLNLVSANVRAMLQEPVAEKLPQIGQPVWVIYGKQDYLIPNKILHPTLTMEDLEKNCEFDHADSRFQTIDNAGHFLVWEQPEKLNELIMEFVQAEPSK